MPWSLVENLESIRIASQILFAMDSSAPERHRRKKNKRQRHWNLTHEASIVMWGALRKERPDCAPVIFMFGPILRKLG